MLKGHVLSTTGNSFQAEETPSTRLAFTRSCATNQASWIPSSLPFACGSNNRFSNPPSTMQVWQVLRRIFRGPYQEQSATIARQDSPRKAESFILTTAVTVKSEPAVKQRAVEDIVCQVCFEKASPESCDLRTDRDYMRSRRPRRDLRALLSTTYHNSCREP
jgi:hypothetical protein